MTTAATTGPARLSHHVVPAPHIGADMVLEQDDGWCFQWLWHSLYKDFQATTDILF